LFAAGKLHPLDLKKAVAAAVNELLEPVRKHFGKGKPKQLLDEVQAYEITR
jgi:tyrosyl-tRNA synthetase